MKASYSIIGCGKVGTALCEYLHKAGYTPVGLSDHKYKNAKETLRITEIKKKVFLSEKPYEVIDTADIVIITTPDGTIEEICKSLSTKKCFKENSVILHCSGSLPSTILSSASESGASVGSMHPLQSFASKENPENPFYDIIMSVEGEKKALKTAIKIAESLKAKPVPIKTDAKTLYHASAVVASNYLVTLIDLAYKLIGKAGVAENDAFEVLKPLINGTLNNIKNKGPQNSLTGPVIRGDTKTVLTHINEINEKASELNKLYKVLGLYTLGIAEKELSDDVIENFKKMFQ